MKNIGFLLLILLTINACRDDDSGMVVPPPPMEDADLVAITYNPTPKVLELHDSLPQMNIPADNPLTEEAVELGRHLFYDPLLSVDSTISCNSCHLLSGGLTDNLAVSFGVSGAAGTRSAMALFNLGFADNGLFWDGAAETLEEQALEPITNPVEMNNTWEDVETKLRRSDFYPQMFREAFGITSREEITRDLAAKAIASFERTLVLFGGSTFDKVNYLNVFGLELTGDELDGFSMFTDITTDDLPDAECEHCHARPLFATDVYRNNGLTPADDLNSFPDNGRGAVTMNVIDNGKFRSPSLRNIALTAPYMHDGRFETLREVVEHYASGGHPSPNISNLMPEAGVIQEEQIDKIVAFLHSLTDTTYLSNPAFQNPFQE